MSDMTVANTIATQLGGIGRLRTLCGAKQFIGSEDSLAIHLPPSSTKGRADRIVIRLNADDLYEVRTMKFVRRTLECVTLETREGVFCDNLMDVFEDMTGLFLTFSARRA